MGVDVVVNLLSADELSYLGADWNSYSEACSKLKLAVIRYPMRDGDCPKDIMDFELKVIRPLCLHIAEGKNVLCHCRGGMSNLSDIIHE